jgi:hypothetical protein
MTDLEQILLAQPVQQHFSQECEDIITEIVMTPGAWIIGFLGFLMFMVGIIFAFAAFGASL